MNQSMTTSANSARESLDYRKIAFIGAGNMATAIIGGVVKTGYPANLITACAPSIQHRQRLHERYHIHHSADNIQSAKQADVIILSVKPQLMADVCTQLAQQIDFTDKLIISIAAGIRTERFYQLLGNDIQLIRVMPNTPALIGQGMSGLYAPRHTPERDKTFTTMLMSAIGKICWVEKEAEINHIIAIAGSAPAYFFLFMEAMQQKALQLGFSPEQARLLIQQSALGTAQMVEYNPSIDLHTLREQVTSKGGTTEQAIHVFQQYNLETIVAEAMQAAIQRAEEMEQLF